MIIIYVLETCPYCNSALQLLKDNKNVLLVSHGNALRALFVHLGFKDEKSIEHFELATGTPICIKVFENDYLLVSNGTKYGLYSKKGELIIPLEYDLIKVFDGDCLSLIKENETAYYFLRSKMYLKPIK